jgi:hypothetical protein
MSQWLVIPKRYIEDKPLPEGFLWQPVENFNQYASIRVQNSAERMERTGLATSLVLGLKQDGHNLSLLISRKDGAHAEEWLDATLEEAVNIMYARFMLGEGELR